MPTQDVPAEVGENDIPTPEYLEGIETSHAMQEYYREQMEEAQRQLMQQPEYDDFAGQPY